MIPALLAAGAQIISGIQGSRASADAARDAQLQADQLLQQYKNLQAPDIEQMKLALQQYQSQGVLSPQQEAALQLGPSAYEQINLDPKYQQAAEEALQQMSGMSKTGLNEIDRAALADAMRKSSAEAQSAQQSILANRAARGMGGSGDELAAALSASQSAANKGSDEAMKVAAMSAQRRMDATGQSASLANALQQAQYQRAAEAAGKKDVIAQFNQNLAQGVQQRNVAGSNQAAAQNLANAQNIANSNVNLGNQQQQYNTQLQQQRFENELKKLSGSTAPTQMAINSANARGDAAGNMWAGIGSGLSQAALAFGGGKTNAAPKVDAAGGTTGYSGDYLKS